MQPTSTITPEFSVAFKDYLHNKISMRNKSARERIIFPDNLLVQAGNAD